MLDGEIISMAIKNEIFLKCSQTPIPTTNLT